MARAAYWISVVVLWSAAIWAFAAFPDARPSMVVCGAMGGAFPFVRTAWRRRRG